MVHTVFLLSSIWLHPNPTVSSRALFVSRVNPIGKMRRQLVGEKGAKRDVLSWQKQWHQFLCFRLSSPSSPNTTNQTLARVVAETVDPKQSTVGTG